VEFSQQDVDWKLLLATSMYPLSKLNSIACACLNRDRLQAGNEPEYFK